LDAVDLLIRKLEVRDSVSAAEQDALRAAAGPVERHPAQAAVVREGEPQSASRLLARGVVGRTKLLPDGGRQISSLHVAGDFVDLHSLPLKRLDHDLMALTPVELVVFPHDGLRRITEREPHLTRLLWLTTMLDAATHREWLTNAGRKSALQHVAALFCEMLLRQQVAGLTDGSTMPFPLTQIDLADCCGLSPVHVNRVVQELREQGLIVWRARKLTVLDFARLSELAHFDPAFLVLKREPR
jgi:CRP-like cAMP-binding protein